jgi:hypothetical protein
VNERADEERIVGGHRFLWPSPSLPFPVSPPLALSPSPTLPPSLLPILCRSLFFSPEEVHRVNEETRCCLRGWPFPSHQLVAARPRRIDRRIFRVVTIDANDGSRSHSRSVDRVLGKAKWLPRVKPRTVETIGRPSCSYRARLPSSSSSALSLNRALL